MATMDADRLRREAAREALTKPGCGVVGTSVLIACAAVAYAMDGPTWLQAAAAALFVIGLGRRLLALAQLVVVGVLVHAAWGTWWLLALAVLLAAWAVLVAIGLETRFGCLALPVVVGVLVHAAWGTWWLLVPAALLLGPNMSVGTMPMPTTLSNHAALGRRADRLLGKAYRTKREDMFRSAVAVLRQAVAVAPPGHPRRAAHLARLCNALCVLANAQEGTELLEEAVRVGREAVGLITADDPSRAEYLSVLVQAQTQLFQRNRDEALLEEAVRNGREAVAAAPADDPDPHRLAGVAITLNAWMEHTGDWTVQEEMLQLLRGAVAATRRGGPLRIERQSNLASALVVVYYRTGDTDLLEEAVRVGREAVGAARGDLWVDVPLKAMCSNNLGIALQHMGERKRDVTMLEESVELGRTAVALSVANDPGRAVRLANLCSGLQRLARVGGREELWEEAVRAGREADASLAPDDPLRPLNAFALSEALTRLGRTREARRICAAAAAVTRQPVFRRVAILWRAADLDLLAGDHDRAAEKVEAAVELVPRVAPYRLARTDREFQITSLSGLASTAAAALVAAGNPGRAVELLEQSRGVVLAGTLDTRGDLTELRAGAPSVAREFTTLREAIETADHPDRRAELDRRWEELLARIRRIPGFADFLLPPPIDRLRRQAAAGPIVYVTAHRRCGYALAVVDDADRPVKVVELPDFTQEAAGKRVDLLRDAQRAASDGDRPASERRAAQRQVLEILGWLWDAATGPTLEHLGRTAAPGEGQPWPRLWWCPVGGAALLPLHAAGHHDGTGDRTVMDRVISSYTPTIRALDHARRPGRTKRNPSVVVVAVPDAPDSAPLRGVTREAGILRELFPAATVLPRPDHDSVTAALPEHAIAHFACHGLTDPNVPAESRLLLHDHLERPLTVATVVGLRLDRAELAYLSACGTTETAPHHADEATHITGAFHLAGYRSVIGTMWPIDDRAATTVTRDFYTRLRKRNGVPEPTAAAEALHHALRNHRDRHPALPTQWAAYLHTGR